MGAETAPLRLGYSHGVGALMGAETASLQPSLKKIEKLFFIQHGNA